MLSANASDKGLFIVAFEVDSMATATASLQLLDTVALIADLPGHNLVAGQVGTIVEQLAPEVFEVEFSDEAGQTYAQMPLPQHHLLRLIYAPIPTMTQNNTHQTHSGSGDNVSGDKIMGDQVARDKIGAQYTTHLPNANIANFANHLSDNAQQTASQFTQTSGATTAELLDLISQIRQTAQQFPAAVQEDLIIDIDDVETEIKKPENQRNMGRLRKRLLALTAAVGIAAAPMTATLEMTNKLLDLGERIGIELPQLP